MTPYMTLDEQTEQLVKDRILQISSHKARNYLTVNPTYPELQKLKDLEGVKIIVSKLKIIHSKIEAKVKEWRQLAPEITDQTTMCAVYLIYGKVLQTWEAIFVLSELGYNFSCMELVRSIIENLSLIETFHLDIENKHLAPWFKGKIIDHGTSRKVSNEFVNSGDLKTIKEAGISFENMARDVYRGMSKYSHCSYVALLDSVDVFNEDFDWTGYAGAHYTLHNIHMLENTMTAMLITVKLTCLSLKDSESYKQINDILIQYAGPMDEQTFKGLIPKIKDLGSNI